MRLRMAMAMVVFYSIFLLNLHAQVLITGQTGGKGGQAVLVSANGIFPDGLSLFNAYGQYGYGLTDRFDGMLILGSITALGRTHEYAGIGWNLNLLSQKKSGVDVSFFNTVTTPLNKTSESSTLLMTPAIVVSRSLTLKGVNIAPYSGLNLVAPIGAVRDKLFTPPKTIVNLTIGSSINLSKKWILFVEYDPAINNGGEQTAGLGLLRTF